MDKYFFWGDVWNGRIWFIRGEFVENDELVSSRLVGYFGILI